MERFSAHPQCILVGSTWFFRVYRGTLGVQPFSKKKLLIYKQEEIKNEYIVTTDVRNCQKLETHNPYRTKHLF